MTVEYGDRLHNQENGADPEYLNLLQDILDNGNESGDRTGTGTKKVFGKTLKFNLQNGYPLLTTKKLPFRVIKEELFWFIRGEKNIRPLVLNNVNIWNEWPFQNYLEKSGQSEKFPVYSEDWQKKLEEFVENVKSDEKFAQKWGDLGPVYGYQWRHWKTSEGIEIDQLENAVYMLKNNPDSRRIIVSAWNPADVEKMALPPCHMTFQFQSTKTDSGKRTLNCVMYQRSVDAFLGLPFNIASYALLTEIVAKITDHKPGELTLFLGDTHLYLNHIKQAKLQLSRGPKPLPQLIFENDINDLNNLDSKGINVVNYNPHPHISASISV